MSVNQRVDAGRRQLAAAFLGDFSKRARAVLALIDVHRFEPIDLSFGLVGKVVVGVMHIDVLGIPPHAGSSTANSVVALGGHGWLEWSVWNVSPGMMRLPSTISSLQM